MYTRRIIIWKEGRRCSKVYRYTKNWTNTKRCSMLECLCVFLIFHIKHFWWHIKYIHITFYPWRTSSLNILCSSLFDSMGTLRNVLQKKKRKRKMESTFKRFRLFTLIEYSTFQVNRWWTEYFFLNEKKIFMLQISVVTPVWWRRKFEKNVSNTFAYLCNLPDLPLLLSSPMKQYSCGGENVFHCYCAIKICMAYKETFTHSKI